MITKIHKIKDFGVFKNFSGTGVPDFKTFNLIYGWNYSGKTTLSRVFRCFEKGSRHPDYLTASFSLQADATTIYDETFGVNPNIRVFNSDFVRENLKWDADNFEPIFLLGAENIELQTELKTKLHAYETERVSIEEAKKARKEKSDDINAVLTNKAREVTTLLGLGRNFDRDKLKTIVESIKGKTDQFKLSDLDFEKLKTQALSTEQKPIIPSIDTTIPSIESIIATIQSLLNKQLVTSNKIQKLLDDKNLSDWVEAGKDLHSQKSFCEFCGNLLPADLLTRLNDHFSQDYEVLKSDIDVQLEVINKILVNSLIPAETAFYTDLVDEFRSAKLSVVNEEEVFNKTLNQLQKCLNAKRERPFDQIAMVEIRDNSKEFRASLSGINAAIEKNNKRSKDFQAEKDAAIQKIKEDYAVKCEENDRYSEIIEELEDELEKITKRETANDHINLEILGIRAQLDETVKGAEKINEALRLFFGKDDVQIYSTPDKKFQLLRGDEIAKNLSEGERTSISFAYFVTKLEEQNNKLINTIVYIDDPVSSLDANHLFNIYSFIKTTFYEFVFDPGLNKNLHKAKCKQLFISTHNFDFHNLVYDWFKEKNIGKDKQGFFMVERHKNSYKDESVIKKNSNLITQFNSEYAYLYSIINGFQKVPVDTNESLYHLPNIARRFLETFLNFKYMSPHSIEEKIGQLITNAVDCEKVRKFVHYHSHSLTTDKFVKFADLSECESVLKIVIDAIKENDPIHFTSLEEAISKI